MCECGNYKDGKCIVNDRDIEEALILTRAIPAWCPVVNCSIKDPIAYVEAVINLSTDKTTPILELFKIPIEGDVDGKNPE